MANGPQKLSVTVNGQLGSPEAVYGAHLMPTDQLLTFQNTEHLFPTRIVRKGNQTRALAVSETRLTDLEIRSGKKQYDLYDYVALNRVVGLLVIKDGKVVREQYEFGTGPQTRWMSMSMAKSFSTTLVGAAIQDGFIGSVDDLLVDYLPQLKASGYEGVSIRQLLQMTSGVRWDDTHTDPSSERRRMLTLQTEQQSDAILNYMTTLPSVAAPGTVWNYSTGETHIVGALVKAATGKWLSDYLSEKIWSVTGMEQDAEWWLEAPGGLEVAGSGLCATLRDYVRFGLFMMDDGVVDGHRVLPEGWVEEATAPTIDTGTGHRYGYMWWAVADADGGFTSRSYSARGIFGQYVYINPKENVVIGVISSRIKPRFSEVILDNDFFNATVKTLA